MKKRARRRARRPEGKNGASKAEIMGSEGSRCAAALHALKRGCAAGLACRCIGAQDPERFEIKKERLARQGAAILE